MTSLLVTAAISLAAAAPPSPTAIAEARFVRLNGVEQWITIRGLSRTNPILLILHGGPGDTQSPLTSIYAPLEQDFVVVQWDQRGAGKTLARAGASQPTSLAQIVGDGIFLTKYLKGYLKNDRVVLVGHSWGSFLGMHIVKRQPRLFRAFVGTGQVVSWREMVEDQYRYTLERARAESITAVVAELEAAGVPPATSFERYLVMRRRLNGYLAVSDQRWIPEQERLMRANLTADEVSAYWRGFQTMSGLSATVFSMDAAPLAAKLEVPYFLIQGGDDHITPAAAAVTLFDAMRAPFKRLTRIDGAGHFALMTHTTQFAAALRDDLNALGDKR